MQQFPSKCLEPVLTCLHDVSFTVSSTWFNLFDLSTFGEAPLASLQSFSDLLCNFLKFLQYLCILVEFSLSYRWYVDVF